MHPGWNKFAVIKIFKWAGVPVVVAALLAWAAANAAPTEPAHMAPKSASEAASAVQRISSSVSDVSDLKDRLKTLEDMTRQNYALELDGQRKKVDWWLSFLAVILAVLAVMVPVAGFAIPYFMVHRDREAIEKDKTAIEQDRKAIEQDRILIEKALNEVKDIKDEAEGHLSKTRQSSAEAEKILKSVQSGTPSASGEKVDEAVAKVRPDETADPLLRLRAQALAAGNEKDKGKAHTLWAGLAELAPNDAIVQFNAGYWAQELAKDERDTEKLRWLRLAGRYYAKALGIKTDMHEAVHNWGIALDEEAAVLCATDLNTARSLWRQAGEKFQQALNVNPGLYDAENAWGAALSGEARALYATDPHTASELWRLAEEKYHRALAIKPDYLEAMNNLGILFDSKARAVYVTDPDMARKLWRQAGEQFQRALAMMGDNHQVAKNWGHVLLSEANAVAATDVEYSNELLKQVEQLLLAHAEAAPGVVAYNLACVYSIRGDLQSCLKWLRVSEEHGELPDRTHVRTDKDLDAVRNAPEFIEWFRQAYP